MALIASLEQFRKDNSDKKIGVTFSCWDLLHAGHNIFLDDNFVTPKSAVRSKAAKKKIAFSDVSVFYFNRVQGFSSVPR